jgi:hypothetical protein
MRSRIIAEASNFFPEKTSGPTIMAPPETLNAADVATLLYADPETVLTYARCGELPGTRIGKSWVFLRADVLDFLRARIAADTKKRRCAASVRRHDPVAIAVPASRSSTRRRAPPVELPALPIDADQRSP